MAKITYIGFDGEENVLDVENGRSVMQAAVGEGLRGIIGDCAGSCSCATCHVYVDPAWFDKLAEPSEMEAILLEEVCEPQPTSRLSCQITVSDALDGLVVRMPEKQV